jgi:hypothetical protein
MMVFNLKEFVSILQQVNQEIKLLYQDVEWEFIP